jgi:hypothetical protein
MNEKDAMTIQNASPPTAESEKLDAATDFDWLNDLVTDKAKKNPNWRAKAITGYALTDESVGEADPLRPLD